MTGREGAGRNGPGSRAIFLDFDGTLVEIAPRPDAVVVEPGLPELLDELRRACGGALAIVSGRSIAAIDAFLPGLDLDICGLHGMERRRGGQTMRVAVPALPALRAQVPDLQARLSGLPGVLIEDKGESLALHWRLNPEAEPVIRDLADTVVHRTGPAFRIQDGKALVEIVPAESGKGRAIAALMAEPPYQGRPPLFVGDDVTDEHGFATVRELGGDTVKVGPGPTLAARRIATPLALRGWLRDLASGRGTLDALEPVSEG